MLFQILLSSVATVTVIVIGTLVVSAVSSAPLQKDVVTETNSVPVNATTITASSSLTGHAASLANDGNTATYWENGS